MTVDNVLDFTPELRREGLALLEGYEYGPLYTPIGERPTILMPGRVGGANWKGAAFNPETAILYVPSQRLPLAFDAGSGAAMTGARDAEQAAADGSAGLVTGPDGLLSLQASLRSPDRDRPQRWRAVVAAALGDGPRSHPRIAHLGLGRLGGGGRADALVTRLTCERSTSEPESRSPPVEIPERRLADDLAQDVLLLAIERLRG